MDKNLVIYSLENSIKEFFSTQTTATKAECDAKAASLVGEPVQPVPIQGECSYTVAAGPDRAQIVQFRSEQSTLNLTHLDLARQSHPSYVPKCTYHGQVGGQRPLSVFVMEKCDGTCYIVSIDRSPEGRADFEARQLQTVRDLARFFAGAWNRPQQVPPDVTTTLRQGWDADFSRLSKELPNRFLKNVIQVRDSLSRVFDLPFVVSHGDLNETNIIVNKTGEITGIVGWAEAGILPFGISLWALEGILGWMDSEGWHYHDNAGLLRAEFWRVFEAEVGSMDEQTRESIGISRMAGLFLRHAFKRGGPDGRAVADTDFALRYANSLCTGDIWARAPT